MLDAGAGYLLLGGILTGAALKELARVLQVEEEPAQNRSWQLSQEVIDGIQQQPIRGSKGDFTGIASAAMIPGASLFRRPTTLSHS